MPVTVDIDDAIISLRMVGSYEPADIRRALLAALDGPDRAPVVGLVFDVRGSESLADRPADEVRMMGEFLATQGARFGWRVALLASADYAYGLMRLGSVTLESAGVPNQVFRDEASAREWLLSSG